MSIVAEKIRKGFQSVKQFTGRFVAQRNVPPEVSRRQIEEEVPLSWKKDEMLWGYVNRYMLKGSGAGLFDPAIFDPAFFDTTAIVTLYVNKTLKAADSSSLSDAILRNKAPLIVSDAVLLSDLVNVITEAIVKAVADVVGLADQALVNKPVAIADTVGIVEAVLRHKPSVTVADVVAAAEAVLVSKLLMAADSVSLADVAKVLKTLRVSDALSLVDAVGVPSRMLRVLDGVGLADAVSTPSRVLQVLDAMGLADGAFVNKALQVTDAICLVEVVWAGKRRETALYLVVGNLVVNLKTGKVDFAL